MSNIFEQAARAKMRFQFRGMISAEDLWDLSLEELDTIFKDLTKKAKAIEGESLMKRNVENDKLNLAISLVQYVFETKVAEENARLNSAQSAAEKANLMEILRRKQQEKLLNMTEEELLAKINEL